MICQYCGHKLTDGKCLNPACPGTPIVHKFNLPNGEPIDIVGDRIWFYNPIDYLTFAEVEDLLVHIINVANSVKGVYKYSIDSPGESAAGIRSFTDEVMIIVDSGDPGGEETGEDSFAEHMRQALTEWYDGAKVTNRKAGE
ncbi:MAG: hypothetical protein BWY95_00962 [Bacteroidetes bacterium ADurb.BinA104]|nr:MAG: hypothetical protein BWY95_00962 [Bacteroidetes bacterium ADurb.BinA104]